MVICPKCEAENRPEAAFCVRCGTILFARPAPPAPVGEAALSLVPEQPEQSGGPAHPEPVTPYTGLKRPNGSIFAGRFSFDSLVSSTEHEVHYVVTEITQPDFAPVVVCSNPDCRTIHCPLGSEVERYCSQCGQPMDQGTPTFLLTETDVDKFASVQPVIDLHLVHPNVHPPVAAFQENINSTDRYCLVAPISQDIPDQPEVTEILDWGTQLAQALDYMQSKGVVLGDDQGRSMIGLSNDKVVWRNFDTARLMPMLSDREKINNLRQLAYAMYYWMTGKTAYSVDPYLPNTVNELFEKALVGEGFTSGAEFEKALNRVKTTGPTRLNLDFQLGRRTHPGQVRKNNEDSLLSFELSRMNQGIILPICLVAVADGMGGHASGELASNLVIDAIAHIGAFELVALQNPSFEEFGDWVKRAAQAANQAVFEARKENGNDMGSTLVLGLVIGSQAYLGHIGDSRVYLVNQAEIRQLTTDHSLVQHLVAIGKINQDEARVHPQRNVIYRSLGEKPEVEADYLTQQLFPNDRLLFCSDGLTNSLDDQLIRKIVMEAKSPQAACDQLIDEANAAGGDDNISALVLEVLSF